MEFVILALFVLGGVIGTLMPLVPGTGLILIGAFVFGAMTGFDPLTGTDLAVLTGLSLVGGLGQYAITGLGARTMGASRHGAVGATVGFVLGLLLPVPGGVFLGTFAGAFAGEVLVAVKTVREGLKSGLGAAVSAVLSLFFEFLVALAMVGLILYRVIPLVPSPAI